MAKRTETDGRSFRRLVEVMNRLLAPDGCPWDRKQTLTSVRPYLLEETYEVLDAMEHGTAEEHCEELGDLLMQIVFQAALRQTEGAFGIDEVCDRIADKLIHRHPHVFADSSVADADAVVAQWDEIKEREREQKGTARQPSALDGVPRTAPALARAQTLTDRAARVGFDSPKLAGCRAKVDEGLAEVDRAIAEADPGMVAREIGDLLLAAVNLARKAGVHAETALVDANARFVRRFQYVEARLRDRGRTPRRASLAEMDELWDRAKAEESAK